MHRQGLLLRGSMHLYSHNDRVVLEPLFSFVTTVLLFSGRNTNGPDVDARRVQPSPIWQRERENLLAWLVLGMLTCPILCVLRRLHAIVRPMNRA
jgi:hypothetical protein